MVAATAAVVVGSDVEVSGRRLGLLLEAGQVGFVEGGTPFVTVLGNRREGKRAVNL